MSVNSLTSKYNTIVNCIKTPVSIQNPITDKREESLGIWDTGATNSCITAELAAKLNLIPVSKAFVKGVHGSQEVNVYFLRITLNNQNIILDLLATEAAELSDDHKTGMLIGMDVISKGDFCISNFENKTAMTFHVPSVETVDYVSEIDKYNKIVKIYQIQSKRGIEKCPCGSGKSYKNCCGKSKYSR